jgi:glycosyltransferase involved in cell wall biosynthesis
MESGMIVPPTPVDIAGALDEIWSQRIRSRKWGETGRAIYRSMKISWDAVVEQLLK